MKMKSRTKKILVLSVMVVLLVTTGVLNFVLNDRLTASKDNLPTDSTAVVQTFFQAARSDRDARRESQFLYLDAIINSSSSSDAAKNEAEAQKLAIVKQIDEELSVETAIKGKGYSDAIVTFGDGGVTVVVANTELSAEEANIIADIVTSYTSYSADSVNVVPY